MREKKSGKGGIETPVVCVVGSSKSGKTTLIVGLVRELTKRGYRIATIKHTHHPIESDQPGKDSWLHRKAGAKVSVLCSNASIAVFGNLENEPSVNELCDRFIHHVDLVLVEGYKKSVYPKIVVIGDEKWDASRWTEVRAVVSNHSGKANVPIFKPGDIKQIADFIEQGIFSPFGQMF